MLALASAIVLSLFGFAPAGVTEAGAAPGERMARPLKVALQVGHWKINELPEALDSLSGHTGSAGGGRTELQMNLEIAHKVAPLLRMSGVVVDILPATVPTGYTADAFIAIHADGNSSTSARGFKVSTRWRSPVAVQDARLVEILTEEYGAATALPEDSNVTRNMRGYYAYATWRPNWRISNFTPAAIVELGYMTNAADRAVMFNQTQNLVIGVTRGILRYLSYAYPGGRQQAYGFGIPDPSIDLAAPAFPRRSGGGGSPVVTGDWQALLMGPAMVPVYDRPGSKNAIASLPRRVFHHSTLRSGDYYRITLPDGREGWLHRNSVILKM
jgi:hypothetical protein